MRALATALLVCCACGFSATASGGGSGQTGDASVDALVDAAPGGEPIAATCTTTGLACSVAAVVIGCAGGCWVGCRESATHATAKQRCATWGGELVRLESVEQQTCVNTMFSVGVARWIGLEQIGTTWSWSGDGMPMPYANWAPGQPNDDDGVEDGQEQCAYMSTPTGLWHDTRCGSSVGGFICRR